MKKGKTATPAWWGLLIIGFVCLLPVAAAWGQDATPEPSVTLREDFSDDELKSFVKANERVMAIQMEGEQKMIKAIEDQGLTLDRFNQILEEQRNPTSETESTEQELKSFNNAAQAILQENARIEQQMTASIEEEGIDADTYQQIMLAYQQNPSIQSRVNKMVKGEN